jgi:hypothetical protein
MESFAEVDTVFLHRVYNLRTFFALPHRWRGVLSHVFDVTKYFKQLT